MEKESILVAVEGIDGVGKSSAIPIIANTLEELGYNTLTTREPYMAEVCDAVHNKASSLSPMELYDLMLEDRKTHVYDVILPHLASPDRALVTDRYMYSSIAYNSSEELEPWMILQEHQVNTIPEADILILMDMDVQDAQERLYTTRGFVEEFETRTMQKAQRLFRTSFDTHTCAIYIDASTPIEKVHADLRFKIRCALRLMQVRNKLNDVVLWSASEKSSLLYQDSIPYRIIAEDTSVRITKGSAGVFEVPCGILRAGNLNSTHTVLLKNDEMLGSVDLILSPMDEGTFDFVVSILKQYCGHFDNIVLL